MIYSSDISTDKSGGCYVFYSATVRWQPITKRRYGEEAYTDRFNERYAVLCACYLA